MHGPLFPSLDVPFLYRAIFIYIDIVLLGMAVLFKRKNKTKSYIK